METEECSRVQARIPHARHGSMDPDHPGSFTQCDGYTAPDDQRCEVVAMPNEDESSWMRCILSAREPHDNHAFSSEDSPIDPDLIARLKAYDGAVAAPERTDREGDSQPLPVGTDEEDTQAIVIRMVAARRDLGIRRYGQPLQPSNGRDSLLDAIEEGLDLLVYLVNHWRATHPGEDFPL